MSVIAWAPHTTPSTQQIFGVEWAPGIGKLVAYGDDITATPRYVLTSTDSNVWTKTNIGNVGITNVVWCPGFNATAGFFIASGYDTAIGGALILSSPNGTVWTVRRSIPTLQALFSVAYSADLNRAIVGGLTGALFYSNDGITWNDVSVGGTACFQNMGWAPGLPAPSGSGLTSGLGVFAAFTNVSKEIYVSTDGITWAHNTTHGPDQRDNNTSSGRKLVWVARFAKFYGDTGVNTGKINVSTDGWNWTTQNVPIPTVTDLAWDVDDNLLGAIGLGNSGEGASLYSVDGVTWTQTGQVLAVGPAGRMVYANLAIQVFVCTNTYQSQDTTKTFLSGDVTMPWWTLTLPDGTVLWQKAVAQPIDFTLSFDLFADGTFYPFGTTFSWVVSGSAPTNKGWVFSLDALAGQAYLVNNDSRPEVPRGWTEIVSFATGSANIFGGFPGAAANFGNKLVYAVGSYTVGTTNPTVRLYDGQFDRLIATLPNTTSGAVPKAIMSMVVANGLIYLATLDSGTDSTNWAGRVFSLDVETGELVQIGSAFPAGHLPYALCWHAGRLWCGSHRQSSAAAGKIFFIRPGIDTDWTADHDLTGDALASCTTLWSYLGKLYVGTAGAAGTFAKVLVRDTLGAYSTSLTLSGGAAAANNAVLSMVDFGGNLYAGYWNPDGAGNVATIRKFDGTSWTTVYTGSGESVIPFLALFADRTTMFAIGGGVGRQLIVLTTTTGTSWSDQTIFIPDATSTGIPAFGVVVH